MMFISIYGILVQLMHDLILARLREIPLGGYQTSLGYMRCLVYLVNLFVRVSNLSLTRLGLAIAEMDLPVS
jgi:hypothetical protein